MRATTTRICQRIAAGCTGARQAAKCRMFWRRAVDFRVTRHDDHRAGSAGMPVLTSS
jgi:hypothetical protein